MRIEVLLNLLFSDRIAKSSIRIFLDCFEQLIFAQSHPYRTCAHSPLPLVIRVAAMSRDNHVPFSLRAGEGYIGLNLTSSLQKPDHSADTVYLPGQAIYRRQ